MSAESDTQEHRRDIMELVYLYEEDGDSVSVVVSGDDITVRAVDDDGHAAAMDAAQARLMASALSHAADLADAASEARK